MSRRSISIFALGCIFAALSHQALAQSQTDLAVQLLAEATKCPLPPDEQTGAQGRKERVVSEYTFTGNRQRLSGYRIDTIRAYNPATNTVDVNLARLDLVVNFSEITVVTSEGNLVGLKCDHNCFHITETRGGKSKSSDLASIVQPLCNEATANNAIAAIEALVRANGGHLSSR